VEGKGPQGTKKGYGPGFHQSAEKKGGSESVEGHQNPTSCAGGNLLNQSNQILKRVKRKGKRINRGEGVGNTSSDKVCYQRARV